MKISTGYKLTKYLVLASLAGSLASLLTLQAGLGELYPFFHWKLYSQPLGSAGSYTFYRIYSRKTHEAHYQRRPVRATSTFSAEEYVYTFNDLVANTLADTAAGQPHRKRLLRFIQHVEPGADQYKVVAEIYHPKAPAQGICSYDTATVITFQ